MSEESRRGRKPRAEAATSVFPLRLSPYERARIEAASRVSHQQLADWCRDALLNMADDYLEASPSASTP